jgi:hypothetical protein
MKKSMSKKVSRVLLLTSLVFALGCAEAGGAGSGVEIQIFTATSPNLDPIPAGMPTIRVTARDNITGAVLKTKSFGLGESGSSFQGLPFHDNMQLVVEGLDANDFPIYRGMSTPFGFRATSTDRRIPIFFSPVESFSEATALTSAVDGSSAVQPVRFSVGLSRAGHSQTPLPGGRVLFTGGAVMSETEGLAFDLVPDGLNLVEIISTVEVYDPALGRFFQLPDMVTPRAFHTTTQLLDGRILVVGGITVIDTDNGPVVETVRVAEIFDPSLNRWSQLTGTGSQSSGRAWHTATLRRIDDGKVVIIGGRNIARGEVTYLADAEVFNPATNAFESDGSGAVVAMASARAEHTAVLMRSGLGVGSDIIVLGGINDAGPVGQTEMLRAINNNTSFEFDANFPPMQVPRFGHSSLAVTPEGGNLIVSACGTDSDGRAVSNIEVYDVATGSVLELGNLVSGRSHAGVVELPFSHKLVVVGGLDSNGQTLNSAESLSYNAVTGRYSSLPASSAMLTPRFMHTITHLSNGLVLISGGVGGNGDRESLNSIELFNADDGSPISAFLTQ